MKLHKLVNGEKIELSEEEEAKLRAEWAENKKKHDERRLKHKAGLERKQMLRKRFADQNGFTAEEVDLLLGKQNDIFGY